MIMSKRNHSNNSEKIWPTIMLARDRLLICLANGLVKKDFELKQFLHDFDVAVMSAFALKSMLS